MAALAPRRYRVHRHPHAKAIGAAQIGCVFGRLGVDMIFVVGGNGRCADGTPRLARRGGRWRYMVEQAVVFVEIDQEYRARPDLRVGGERIE